MAPKINYLVLHVMSRSAVHVIVGPLEEVIFNYLQILAMILQFELILSEIVGRGECVHIYAILFLCQIVFNLYYNTF